MVNFNNVKNDEKFPENLSFNAENDKFKICLRIFLKKYLKISPFYIAKYRKIVYNGESDNSQNIQ